MANRTLDLLLVSTAAFAGGYVAGLLLAPRSGEETRHHLSARAKEQMHWMEQRVNELEDQLETLEERVRTTGATVGDRVREAATQAMEQVTPSMPDDPQAWAVDDDEVAHDLRHMPRK